MSRPHTKDFKLDGLKFEKHTVMNAYPKNIQANKNVKWLVTDQDGVMKELVLKSRRSSINEEATAVYLPRKIGTARADLVNDDDTFVDLTEIARMEGDYYLAVDKNKGEVNAVWLGAPPSTNVNS
ncbi:uncharacterized protein LOC144434559 [Glandiceps talaboti]